MGVCLSVESEFGYDIVEEFLAHFSWMVDSLEHLIMGLKEPTQYKGNIDQIFRIFHNIKSSTSYLKLTPIIKLATLVEEVLEECRLVEGAGSDALVSWLIIVSDQLRDYYDDLEQDNESFSSLNPHVIKIPTEYITQ